MPIKNTAASVILRGWQNEDKVGISFSASQHRTDTGAVCVIHFHPSHPQTFLCPVPAALTARAPAPTPERNPMGHIFLS